MNFHFNEEEQEILDMLHDYAVKEVAPRAHEIDEEEKFIVLQHLLYYPLMNLFAAGLFTNTVQKNRKRNTLQLLLQVRS